MEIGALYSSGKTNLCVAQYANLSKHGLLILVNDNGCIPAGTSESTVLKHIGIGAVFDTRSS